MIIKYKLENGAIKPTRKYDTDAGMDLYTPVDFSIDGGSENSVDIGVHLAIPSGFYGQIVGRSGLASKGVYPIGGVIDSGYTGSIRVALLNNAKQRYEFKAGERIAQIVFLPVPRIEFIEVDELDDTSRGSKGFGSSGR